jgi:polysaccharide biosynthesis protein PslG
MQNFLTTAFTALLVPACIVGDSAGDDRHVHAAVASDVIGLNVPGDGTGVDTVADLGAHWVRVELVDGSMGTDLDANTAARFSATLDAYHARGASVLVIADYGSLGGNPGFGYGAACAGWSEWRAAWLARIATVASRFGSRIDAWEIWNEPDQPMLACGAPEYNPGMPAAEYGPLLRDAYQAIRGAGAGAPIVTGGLDSGQVHYITDAAAAAGGLFADGVSIHPYGVVPDASWCPNPGEDLNCEWGTLGGKVDEYAGATGLPVWVTEFGVKSADTQHQANYLTDGFAAFANHGAAHAFLFCASDAMVEPFGLTYADWTPKPNAYAAFQALGSDTGGTGGGTTHTQLLHGTVEAGGGPIEGLTVTAWGQSGGDFHATTTDVLGIYQFTDLTADSLYNVVVNAQFDASTPGGFDAIDGAHGFEVRNNVELVSGPDGWHGEDFGLGY